MPSSTGLVSVWGETDVCANRYHERQHDSNLSRRRRDRDTGDVKDVPVTPVRSVRTSLVGSGRWQQAAVRCSSTELAIRRILGNGHEGPEGSGHEGRLRLMPCCSVLS
jgi:hypothetical protein